MGNDLFSIGIGHSDDLGEKLTDHIHQILLVFHDLMDILVGEWSFIQIPADQVHSMLHEVLFKFFLRDTVNSLAPRHEAAGPV